MIQDTAHRLLALNDSFYASAALQFAATRRGIADGMVRCLAYAPPANPLTVLDVGCGNARLLQALAAAFPPERAIVYLGVESDAGLLAMARSACEDFARGPAHALRGDILARGLGLPGDAGTGDPGTGDASVDGPQHDALYDVVACFAVLHHIPGDELRVQALRNLAGLLAPGGRLLLSTWQFLHSERLRSRIAPWETIGLDAADMAPGDALLPWDDGVHALRYAHHITLDELSNLAEAASLQVLYSYFADGHEGNLNLYAALARKEHGSS